MEVAGHVAQLKDPKNKQNFIRDQIARDIGKLAASSKAAVPALLKMLEVPEDMHSALLGMAEAGPPTKEAVPALLVILKDKDKVKLHTAALDAIGKIGPKDTELLEIITPLIADEQAKGFEAEDARRKALAVLGQIGPDAKAAAPTLYPLLKNEMFLKRSVLQPTSSRSA